MPKLSRSKIASYFAAEIIAGKPDVVTRLSALLVETRRTRELNLIASDIEYELAKRGVVIADVTSALPLDEGFEEAIRQILAVRADDKVVMREHIDTELIGGIKIRSADRELDASVRHKINQLKASATTV